MNQVSQLSAITLCAALALSSCSKSSSDSNGTGGDGNEEGVNSLNWDSIPAEYNPKIEEFSFATDGVEKINIDIFGLTNQVEIIYAKNLKANSGNLKIFRVWKESASWGNLNQRPSGKSLSLTTSGSYACSIKIENGSITSLKGGCNLRLQIFLPEGAEIEVYSVNKLVSKRFFAVDNETLIKNVKAATFAEKKLAAIDDYLKSYEGMSKQPVLATQQLGVIISEFSFGAEKIKALRALHAFIIDRDQLAAMIDSKFSYFDRAEARKIVGL